MRRNYLNINQKADRPVEVIAASADVFADLA
jgi:hypothetical protein